MTSPRPGWQALVLAAGRGTRMKSARAKLLHPALGLPLVEHVLRAVADAGCEAVHVVVGHQAEAVEAACAGRGVGFVRQSPQLGTGHAVACAREAVAARPEPTLLVVNGDLPLLRAATLRGLLDAHRAAGAHATLATAELAQAGAYGRILRDAQGGVRGIVEARDASPAELAIHEINAGLYVFELAPLLAVLDRLGSRNAQGEYYLTDAVALLVADGRRVAASRLADPDEILGVNTLAELADVSDRLRRRRLAELMAEGVTIEDPATTTIGLDARVEADAVIRPFTLLEGATHVRAGAVVGPFARLVDVDVGAGAQVLDHCLLRDSQVGPGASVGPFAHVRPESVIGAGAKVGNFVELKKTRLGDGAKAPHLSYVGDATVGTRVNIGAGTITCNYDGSAKHPTRIEAGAFVGSNTTLVAPVTVGAGAYVAAGSVITQDVPEDALAFGRARQVLKPGWARRRREQLQQKKG